MTIKPIKTHEDYEAALAEVENLFDAVSQDDRDRLEVLATLVEAYEARQFPIAPPDPISAILYEMEKRALTRKDLEPLIGPSGRVSEILNRQRPLTVTMIRNLHQAYGIPTDILMAEYPTARTSDSAARLRIL